MTKTVFLQPGKLKYILKQKMDVICVNHSYFNAYEKFDFI